MNELKPYKNILASADASYEDFDAASKALFRQIPSMPKSIDRTEAVCLAAALADKANAAIPKFWDEAFHSTRKKNAAWRLG